MILSAANIALLKCLENFRYRAHYYGSEEEMLDDLKWANTVKYEDVMCKMASLLKDYKDVRTIPEHKGSS